MSKSELGKIFGSLALAVFFAYASGVVADALYDGGNKAIASASSSSEEIVVASNDTTTTGEEENNTETKDSPDAKANEGGEEKSDISNSDNTIVLAAADTATATAETAKAAATEAASAAATDIAALVAAADVEKGKKVAKKCAACHTFDKGGKNKIGPNLWGIVGANKAHLEDFKYSDALKNKGGKWDIESLDAFLKKPKKYIKGTKMAFGGIKKDEDRAALIAYLASLK